MNAMAINYTRPTGIREIIATTPVGSMLDAFAILKAIAETSSAAEHSVNKAGFDLIDSGRESELFGLGDELDGTALDLLNKIPRDEFTGAPTLDNIRDKVGNDVREAATALGYSDAPPASIRATSYRDALEAMAEAIDEAR